MVFIRKAFSVMAETSGVAMIIRSHGDNRITWGMEQTIRAGSGLRENAAEAGTKGHIFLTQLENDLHWAKTHCVMAGGMYTMLTHLPVF
ncbi:MAG: hypothetical protein ACLSWD_11485 [Clostridium sp.]